MVEGVESLLSSTIKGLSPTNITRMKSQWKQEYEKWKSRDLSNKEYCYIWSDGIHFTIRFDNINIPTTEGAKMSIKSRASFEKRRREKAKKEKRQNKLDRRLERKTERLSGAYISDEYGNRIVSRTADEEGKEQTEDGWQPD